MCNNVFISGLYCTVLTAPKYQFYPFYRLIQLSKLKFSQKIVSRALSSLDIHNSSGPDGISYKDGTCDPELTPVPVTVTRLSWHLYSVGVDSGLWKSALIHPIPKTGDGFDSSL